MKARPSAIFSFALATTSLVLTTNHLSAQTNRVWDGGSFLFNAWDTPGGFNWNPNGNPVAGDSLFFAGSSRTTNNNNYDAGTTFAGITFNSGAAAFTLNGNRLTLGSVGVINNDDDLQTVNLPLTLTASSGAFNAASGNITVGGIINGSGGILTKTGTNTLTLTQANSYTGATNVNQGKLVVSGSIGNSAVSVSNSGTILATDAAASFGSTITVNSGATFAPGDVGSIGTATVTGTTTFNNGGIFSWDVASASSFDKVSGTAAGSGGAIFNIVTDINDTFWNSNQTFSNVFTGGSLSTIFSNTFLLNGTTLSSGLVANKGTFSFNATGVTWSAIPEPTSALAGILLGVGLLRRRRL